MSSGAFKVTHIENQNILDIYLKGFYHHRW